jgi:hypothetical protein
MVGDRHDLQEGGKVNFIMGKGTWVWMMGAPLS